MQTSGYTTLTRLSGLRHEMQVVANNIANANTTGYRQQGIVFSEFIQGTGGDSVSMAAARIEMNSLAQGELRQTNGPFDVAIEGDGFFQIGTPDGNRLTRAGAFTPDANGNLVTMDGYPVLDTGGAPVFVPQGADVAIGVDGTVSANGTPLGEIGVVSPVDPNALVREGSQLFRADDGVEPVEGVRVRQGFLEGSNVDPILQISRMIEVQRAYELGQSFLDAEHDRVTKAIDILTR